MRLTKGISFTLVFTILAIFSFGLITIFIQDSRLGVQQFLFLLFGLLIFFLIASFDVRVFKDVVLILWLVSLSLVFLVTFLAPEIRGASRWIDLGFFRLQPTELAKPVVILALATIFEKPSQKYLSIFAKSLGCVTPFFVLTFLQPDLGNAIIFLIIWFLALFVSGFNWKILATITSLLIILLPTLFLVLAPYQRLRLETFINPQGDPLGAGYSSLQSQITVGSGRIFGKGLAGATQSKLEFLPEAPTDFIFASIAESFGFLGAIIFIGLFISLIYQLIRKTREIDRFSQLLTLQIAGLLFLQFFINLAMSVGLLPVVGVTLPFASYGGSSLVVSFILLALVQSRIKFSTRVS